MTKVLNTEKAKASFEKEGYIIISSVFNPEWLSSIRKICDEIIA